MNRPRIQNLRMTPEQRLATIAALLAERLARVEAQNDIILKSQAHFLATMARTDWKPIHQDLQDQVNEVLEVRRREVLEEFRRLSDAH